MASFFVIGGFVSSQWLRSITHFDAVQDFIHEFDAVVL